MALFKNKKIPDLPEAPKPDFQISKPDFDEDFPNYIPTIGGFNDMKSKKPSMNPAPKKMLGEDSGSRFSGPVFIKIEKYEEALDHIHSVKSKVMEIEDLVDKLKRIKHEEDSALEQWKQSLNQVKEKLAYIDQSLFEN